MNGSPEPASAPKMRDNHPIPPVRVIFSVNDENKNAAITAMTKRS